MMLISVLVGGCVDEEAEEGQDKRMFLPSEAAYIFL